MPSLKFMLHFIPSRPLPQHLPQMPDHPPATTPRNLTQSLSAPSTHPPTLAIPPFLFYPRKVNVNQEVICHKDSCSYFNMVNIPLCLHGQIDGFNGPKNQYIFIMERMELGFYKQEYWFLGLERKNEQFITNSLTNIQFKPRPIYILYWSMHLVP